MTDRDTLLKIIETTKELCESGDAVVRTYGLTAKMYLEMADIMLEELAKYLEEE